MVSNCGPFRFSSNFDSGNFLKVELLEPHRRLPSSQNVHTDYEVNLWTRPDCHGTPYVNGNRTWFHFGIRGGKPRSTIKLNVLNLNKQTKLFHQGMQPVFRILPEQPYWERVQDRLVVNETLDHVCSISFRQRLPDDTKNSTLYVAFSYPFSYIELREWLARLDVLFPQSIPSDFVFDRIKVPLPNDAEQNMVSTTLRPLENEIYYYRECACYSLEGRVVDLITVTSLYGMSSEREERLANLFPDQSIARPHKFPCKKVVFLSARVHPGETPSTFVLNGFFKFVLERNDPRAVLLRRLFVFKFMPMLNPDGVARGNYRTDPRGVNLNRVYLNPSPVLHPSIYAARKLLLYYHFGYDTPDDYEYPTDSVTVNQTLDSCDNPPNENEKHQDEKHKQLAEVARSQTELHSNQLQAESSCHSQDESARHCDMDLDLKNANPVAGTSKKYTFVLSDANSLCAGCTLTPYEMNKKGKCSLRRKDFIDKKKRKKRKAGSSPRKLAKQSRLRKLSSSDCLSTCSSSELHASPPCVPRPASKLDVEATTEQVSMDTDLVENAEIETENHHCAFEACDEDSVVYTSDILNVSANLNQDSNDIVRSRSLSPSFALRENKKEVVPALISETKKSSCQRFSPEVSKSKSRRGVFRKNIGEPEPAKGLLKSGSGIKSSSGLYLYVDMHGHATKRGIFMYGNHFPDAVTQAETMLLPRLMAMNFQHFDFAACNFTERLMSMKDRRDGASREGSGRVACLKLTGLIRSFTLECNYNTGRLVNPIVQRPTSFGFVDPPNISSIHHCVKFTPDIFEGAGKALAESVLDLTGQNPWSRITHTEFKSLDGMRRWMLNRLYHTPEYHSQSRTTNLLSTTKEKIVQKKSSSVTALGIDSSVPSASTTVSPKSVRKRSPKKRSSNKVLAELHPHGTAAPGSSNIISNAKSSSTNSAGVISRNSGAPSRRSSLPNKLNCYSVPSTSRGTDPNRRDPIGR